MKASIIGGGGLVGSCTAFALQATGIIRDVALLDANADGARGQALDLQHGASLAYDQHFYAGTYADVADSDFIIITAGSRRKPDESRLDLINRNVALFKTIIGDVKKAGHKPDATVVVVSNPVDVLTYLATKELSLPWQRVIGLGTVLDTTRFRSLLAARLNVAPTQVSALILGEHGDSMVPIWSSATIASLPMDRWPGVNASFQNEMFTKTKGSGAEVIKLKGGAGFAVGVSIRDVVESIALDRRAVLPVSTLQHGKYGIRDVCLSVPTVVGRAGAIDQIQLDLWPKEMMAIQKSAQVLRGTINDVLRAG
ncbi:L-lactate dehydrogenase [Planctomycetes bacterium Pan216]|uniref:L-lactate dehydrogenase n=1 Tax=Kolteria novifilia TaxID=2527975 RepID=A0A518B9M7_9BACT|nr:L-lactate dehydrogenase [Planctomycetes bacterium Pan216]